MVRAAIRVVAKQRGVYFREDTGRVRAMVVELLLVELLRAEFAREGQLEKARRRSDQHGVRVSTVVFEKAGLRLLRRCHSCHRDRLFNFLGRFVLLEQRTRG